MGSASSLDVGIVSGPANRFAGWCALPAGEAANVVRESFKFFQKHAGVFGVPFRANKNHKVYA